MGQYLACGLAEKIYITKKQENFITKYYTKENIISLLENKLNLEIYDITEDDCFVYLTLKDDIFNKYALSFIEKELNNTVTSEKVNALSSLDQFRNLSKHDFMEELYKKNNRFISFFEGHKYTNNISYIFDDTKLNIFCDLIYFINDGKTFFECYYSLFYYLRKTIIEKSNNPIKDAFVLCLIG